MYERNTTKEEDAPNHQQPKGCVPDFFFSPSEEKNDFNKNCPFASDHNDQMMMMMQQHQLNQQQTQMMTSTRTQIRHRRRGNKLSKIFTFALLALALTMASITAKNPLFAQAQTAQQDTTMTTQKENNIGPVPTNEEELFGKPVPQQGSIGNSNTAPENSPNEENTAIAGEIDPETYVPSLPFTEEQERKRAVLEEKYRSQPLEVQLDSIDPVGGPTSGSTRVTVRGGPFQDMDLLYPNPKCKFGDNELVTHAQYVRCTEKPLEMEEVEGHRANRTSWCLMCEDSPAVGTERVVALSVSLTGDFSDSLDSASYRYYQNAVVKSIYPRYGPKDGSTLVQVWGENFLNFGNQLRCNFGTESVIASYKSANYLICSATSSDVVDKAIPFSISMNKQQNSREDINYWYYNQPVLAQLEPNYGPESGGNEIILKGSGMDPFVEHRDRIDNRNDTFCHFWDLNIKTPARVLNSTKIACTAPASFNDISSTGVDFTLNNQNYTDDDVPYFFYKPPKIYNMEPREGPTRGGTIVHIFAVEFKRSKRIVCAFGDKKNYGKHISDTEIECISPAQSSAQQVPVVVSYESDGDKSKSQPISFLYYQSPSLASIDPPCGPVTGDTQIVVKGRNFVDMGFNKARCVFNGTAHHTNVTILNEETILCGAPQLTRFEKLLPPKDMIYTVQVTLNGVELTPEKAHFAYYTDPQIDAVQNEARGPITGNTVSTLSGQGFKQANLCNLKVRYGALEVTPQSVKDDSHLMTVSPAVGVPDAVTLAVSGNGQQYARDKTLHFRDIENTFTYYQDIFVHDLRPQSGPTTGNTKLFVSALGLKQFKFEDGSINNDLPLYVKFTDALTGTQIGNITRIEHIEGEQFVYLTPKAKEGTKAILSVSFNGGQQWQEVIPAEKSYSYLYYNAPVVTAIEPRFGPVKSTHNEIAVVQGQNFECPGGDCSRVKVRFGDAEFGTIVGGTVLSSTQIQVEIPKYPKPDILTVEVSMNGIDYTNDRVTYGFFDAFVLDVRPKLISKRGGTKLSVKGFGFVNSGTSELKAKFATQTGDELVCNGVSPCESPATFVDKNTMYTYSVAHSSVEYQDRTSVLPTDPIQLEVSVYNSTYTENGIELYYIYDPEFETINRESAPRNIQVPLQIKTNFFWQNNQRDMFAKHANFTCKFTNGEGKSVVTQGRMDTIPLGQMNVPTGQDPPMPDHVVCPSPLIEKSGTHTMYISANGVDYQGEGFPFVFTDPVDVYRVTPQSGPKNGPSKVNLIGSGFLAKDPIFAKIGNFDLEPIYKEKVQQMFWSQEDYLKTMLMTTSDLRSFKALNHALKASETVQQTYVKPAALPHQEKTQGGPEFVSIGQIITLDMADQIGRLLQDEQQVVSQAQNSTTLGSDLTQQAQDSQNEPSQSTSVPSQAQSQTDQAAGVTSTSEKDVASVAVSSGTNKIDKVVVVPPSRQEERYLFTESSVEFYYYRQPVVVKVQPASGLTQGGTPIEISGAWFDQKLEYGVLPYCKIGEKIVRAEFHSTVRIVCASPPNANLAAALPISVSLNGVDFVDTGKAFSYYAQPDLYELSPRSGPMEGGTQIFIKGSLFSNLTDSDNVKCKFSIVKDMETRRSVAKYMPAHYVDPQTMMCVAPAGFGGGDRVNVQLTYNDEDYTPQAENLTFRFYSISGSFPHSGPSDAFNEVIVVKGAGLTVSSKVKCSLNSTNVDPVKITDNMIECPMALPNKDPLATGHVKFGLLFDGQWSDFGNFYYYKQIEVASLVPSFGPSEGLGDLYFSGVDFRDDFEGSQIGCKIGESIGQGIIQEAGVIRCVVEKMDLVDQEEALVAQVSLNSYSWVGGKPEPLLYRPYGITNVSPAAGPYDGFTDVLISGKGFSEDLGGQARCRFGVDQNFAIVEAQVLDYTRMVCRSPDEFNLPENADQHLSVPFGIAFGDEEFKPWTLGTHRYRFYTQPAIETAIPEEVLVGKFVEIYLIAQEGTKFFEPVPSGKDGDTTGILCNFEDFGTSMGLYINETTIMCVTPHLSGRPEDYYRETVQVTLAMNGQDFNEIQSDAYVTFVGTGSDSSVLYAILAIILIALLILALMACCAASIAFFKPPKNEQKKQLDPHVISLRDGSGTVPRSTVGDYGLNSNRPSSRGGSRGRSRGTSRQSRPTL